jgi:hypothetical protein
VWSLVAALAGSPALANADPADAKKALALFEEGRTLSRAGKFAEACAKYNESFGLDPAPGTRLNVADCLERDGKLARALDLFNTAATDFDRARDSERAKFARTRAEALVPRLATVIIKIPNPPDKTRVRIGDRELPGAEEIKLQVDPGPTKIAVHAPGRPPLDRDATLVAGATSTFEVPVPVTAPVVAPVETVSRRSRSRIHLAYGIAAGAGATLIATSVFAIIAKRHYDAVVDGPNCTKPPLLCNAEGTEKINDARGLATIGTGFGVATGILLAAATIIYVTAPHEQVVVTPVVAPGAVGITFERGF